MQGHTKHHIYVGDTRIATLNDSGSLYFTTSDHLGSSTLMTNALGALSELDDYYPYGAVAYENTTTDLDNWYKFTGKELDSETNLQYFGARYYDNNLGRFTSIDPVAFLLHTDSELKQVSGRSLKVLLADPQLLNSYSYTRNNPVVLVDPDGNAAQRFNPFTQMVQGQRDIAQFFNAAADSARVNGGLLGHASGFVADALGSTANSTANLLDPQTEPLPRIGAFLLLLSDVATGGEGKVATKGFASGIELTSLKVVDSAAAKLSRVSQITKTSKTEILKEAEQWGKTFLDTSTKNINIFVERPDFGKELVRVTVEPTLQRIISAGITRYEGVINNIRKGRFIDF